MSTTDEMRMFMVAVEPKISQLSEAMKNVYGAIIEDVLVGLLGREVSAKRMRVLERRGVVLRFSRYTSTGKRRYKWLPAEKCQIWPVLR